MKYLLLIIAFSSVIITGCKKTTEGILNSEPATLQIHLRYNVDDEPIQFDAVKYLNTAGNVYSVERLEYYLSNFRFYKQHNLCYSSDKIFYVNARKESTSAITLTFPQYVSGSFDSVSFLVGIDEEHNKSNSLPATPENVGMGWPDHMGGGYHFMKLEGRWKDGVQLPGYAMHIGNKNFYAVSGTNCAIRLEPAKTTQMTMSMNINEWFRSPHTYSFSGDGVYTMGDSTLMRRIAQNGYNIFKQINY